MEVRPVYIHCNRFSSRLSYTLDLIFKDILGTDAVVVDDKEQFDRVDSAKLSYGTEPLGDELFIFSSELLFEKGIEPQDHSVVSYRDTKALFPTHPQLEIPFDVFASTFYIASRYEEYLPYIGDEHHRFTAKESVAFEKGFLHQPVINIYAEALKELIQERFPDFTFPERKYRFISTIDIDNAWAYLEKGFLRTVGAYLRSILKLDFRDNLIRSRVLLGMQQDPYDTYEHLLQIQNQFGFDSIYFFLLGDYSEFDKNVPVHSAKLQSLIKKIGDYARVGIHPSYASNSDPEKVRLERQRLVRIIKREVENSRQHFLILKFPETYNNLPDLDIKNDYSMGYSDLPGFRSGLCTPYHHYNLNTESKSQLVIHPFMVMDATLRYYMNVEPEEAIDRVLPLINEVKRVNGDFITIWHNESLSDNNIWSGWRNVYHKIIENAVP